MTQELLLQEALGGRIGDMTNDNGTKPSLSSEEKHLNSFRNSNFGNFDLFWLLLDL